MAGPKFHDRVQEFSTTTGVGAMTLDGAVAGFRRFGSVLANGDTCYYALFCEATAEWEVGLGTYATNSLTRTTVQASSNSGAVVNLAAGTKNIWLDNPASVPGRVFVSDDDTTPATLSSKLVAGANVTLVVDSPGGNETITIAASGGGGGGGSGTVTSVSVVTANGFAGTVATATTTPAITLTTTVTGLLKGNGTAISAAVAGTDYQVGDATLTALAALTIAANSLIVGTGADAFSVTTFAANTFPARASTGNLVAKAITDFGLSLVDDANAAAGRTTLGGTTVGQAVFVSTNPSAITFLRANADNTVTWLNAADFRTAIGAGSGTGDVTGPASSVDNEIARFDGTTGKVIQNCPNPAVINDTGTLQLAPGASLALLNLAGDSNLGLTNSGTSGQNRLQVVAPVRIVEATGVPLTVTNTATSASVQVAIFEGYKSSGTPANNDLGYISYQLLNSTTGAHEFARMTWVATDVVDTSEDGQLFWSLSVAGVLTEILRLTGTGIHLASGAVINWNSGAHTLYEDVGRDALAITGGGLSLLNGNLTLESIGALVLNNAANNSSISLFNSGATGESELVITAPVIIQHAVATPLTVRNSANSTAVQVAIFEGSINGTPANNDLGYISYRLENAGSAERYEFARMTWVGTDITVDSEDCQLFFSLSVAGALTEVMRLTSAGVSASTYTSTVATGTAPFVVASTTAVTNLNADLLDGQHAAAFAAASHTHDHGSGLTGLTDDDHTQYALLAGRSGGQILIGGTASGDDLAIRSTSHATKGSVFLGAGGISQYDEVNDRLGIGIVPEFKLHVGANDSTANIVLERADDSAGGPEFDARKSRGTLTSPTIVSVGDVFGQFTFRGYDGSNIRIGGQLVSQAGPGTISTTSMPGRYTFFTTPDGSVTPQSRIIINPSGGMVCGGATGGDKGTGTINAKAVYDDNVLLTDHVFDTYFDGRVTMPAIEERDVVVEKGRVVTETVKSRKGKVVKVDRLVVEEETVKRKFFAGTDVEASDAEIARQEKLKRDGYAIPTLPECCEHMRAKRHLPRVKSREEWMQTGKPSTGELLTQIWEQLEHAHLYIMELHERLDAVEKGLANR